MRSQDIGKEFKGDIILFINGEPILPGEGNPVELVRGLIGESVIITARKSNGSEQTFTIVRSSEYRRTYEHFS